VSELLSGPFLENKIGLQFSNLSQQILMSSKIFYLVAIVGFDKKCTKLGRRVIQFSHTTKAARFWNTCCWLHRAMIAARTLLVASVHE